MNKLVKWISRAFSDNGVPSSSRITSTWLSLSSMALIWYIVRHALALPQDKMATCFGNLPLIIGALATFSTAPYGVSKLAAAFKKDTPADTDDSDASS